MNDDFDLGSAPNEPEDDFDPFDNDETSETETTDTSTQEEPTKTRTTKTKSETAQTYSVTFVHANVTETITDFTQSFDDLRKAKSSDFPELEDGKKVMWNVECGKIIKPVPNVSQLLEEFLTEFTNGRDYKAHAKKEANPQIKLKPRITAQSKGAAYKGVYKNIVSAIQSGKPITYIPSSDGYVYEMRKTDMGRFVTKTNDCDMFDKVESGFCPALPLIPFAMLQQIISFFKSLDSEALVNIYWDKKEERFFSHVPKQFVAQMRVMACDYSNNLFIHDTEKCIHYMDIHSHMWMDAVFSKIDDEDENATRIYTVIGNLDKIYPAIKTRISNGGKFLEIPPESVFAHQYNSYPTHWREALHVYDR